MKNGYTAIAKKIKEQVKEQINSSRKLAQQIKLFNQQNQLEKE